MNTPFDTHLELLGQSGLTDTDTLRESINGRWLYSKDGNLPRFRQVLEQLPEIEDVVASLSQDWISVSSPAATAEQLNKTAEALQQLKPWRKGPFRIFDTGVDAEWRCNLKWDRLSQCLGDIRNRRVLDIGSGNGYYIWRLIGEGAGLVTGVDPGILSVAQFLLLQHFIRDHRAAVLPITFEAMPEKTSFWDIALSMGVLYHRRSPFDHFQQIREALRPGGQLVLETLVVKGDQHTVMVPEGRYAMMNNVYFIPSVAALEMWLRKAGFENVEIIDVTATTTDEQRRTEWKPGTSLDDYLDTEAGTTGEGLPAPVRAMLSARKPGKEKKLPRYRL